MLEKLGRPARLPSSASSSLALSVISCKVAAPSPSASRRWRNSSASASVTLLGLAKVEVAPNVRRRSRGNISDGLDDLLDAGQTDGYLAHSLNAIWSAGREEVARL